jgi:uncharacterized membrane-anchored protein YitT (DUF2179 family)
MASSSKKGLGISDISNLSDSNEMTNISILMMVNIWTQMTAVIVISASKKMMHSCLTLVTIVVLGILHT